MGIAAIFRFFAIIVFSAPSVFALAFIGVVILAGSALAENWARPFEDDNWYWIDLDSVKRGSNGDSQFIMHHGDNPRVWTSMSFSYWVSLNCSTGFAYFQKRDGTWDEGHAYDNYFNASLMRLVCR
jgi:hypothetical protein